MRLIDPDTHVAYPDVSVANRVTHVAPFLLFIVLYIVLIPN